MNIGYSVYFKEPRDERTGYSPIYHLVGNLQKYISKDVSVYFRPHMNIGEFGVREENAVSII